MALNLSGKERDIVRALLGAPNRRHSTDRDWRYGTNGSLSVDVQNGRWYHHEDEAGGNLIELVQRMRGGSKPDAAQWLRKQGFVTCDGVNSQRCETSGRAQREIVAEYDYRDAGGELQFQVLRLSPKSFRQRRPDGRGDWVWSVKGVAPIPYRLPEIAAAPLDSVIFVVEGEKDCDRLSEIGVVATTNPGGAGKWRDCLSGYFSGRRVVVLPDNDDAGQKHGRAVAALLQPHTARLAVLELDDLPEKGDVSDWLDRGGTATDLPARANAALISEKPAAAPEPIPLFRPIAEATEPPSDALGPFLAPAAAIAELTQAPFALAMQSVLAVGSLATQHHADVETLAGDAPLSLALISIAKSGERKSAGDSYALYAVRDFERACLAAHKAQHVRHAQQVAVLEAERHSALKAKDLGALDAIAADPQTPPRPNLVASEPTLEGILRHFDDGRPSIGIFSDEGGQLFGGHAMNRDNSLKTAASLSKLWDGTPLDRVRASAAPSVYHGRRVAIHLMLQPEIADRVLADPMLRDQGLLSRTLVVRPESRIGTRAIPVGRAEAEHRTRQADAKDVFDAFGRRVVELLPLGGPAETSLELSPRQLPLSELARDLLVEFANAVEVEQGAGGALEAIQGFASKASQQAARLAGILRIFEDERATEVSGDTMANAVTLMSWCLGEAQRLLDTGPIDRVSRDAEKLRAWLVDRFRGDEIDVRTIVRCGPNSLRNSSLVYTLTRALERNGWLVSIDRPDNHRKTPVWRVVRP